MRRRALPLVGLVLLACASPAWEQPPPPLRDAPVIPAGALRRAPLGGGLEGILLEDRRLPRVQLGLTLRRGEASLTPERAGLAVFTADLMERGAGDLDAVALARAVEELGASLSVYADWDSMGVEIHGLSRDRDRLLEILADVVLRPRFEPSEAERLRGESLARLERAADEPRTLLGWWTARSVYPGHRYGEPLGGTPGTVAAFDAAAARELHGAYFLRSNAVFSACGDFDSEALLARAGELFRAWPDGPAPAPGPAPPRSSPADRVVRIVDRPELEQAHISLAHEGIERTYSERLAVALMNSVLGGSGFSSRLMQRVRAEEGLAYGVGSGFHQRRVPGPFTVSTSTRVPEARRAIDLLLGEVQKIIESPPSERELRDARTLALGRFALALETSDAVRGALVDLDVYGLPADSLDTYRARLRAVDPSDTAREARERLHPERAAIVLVGPAETLAPLLEGLGAVEVVQP